jgi:hypothetical protein
MTQPHRNLPEMSDLDFSEHIARMREMFARAIDLLSDSEADVVKLNDRLAEAELHGAADVEEVKEALKAATALRNGRVGSKTRAMNFLIAAEAEELRRREANADSVSAAGRRRDGRRSARDRRRGGCVVGASDGSARRVSSSQP